MGAIPLRNEDSVVSETVESIDALVRRAQEGDARAFEAVYWQTTDRVYGLCLRMSGDGAVDPVQATAPNDPIAQEQDQLEILSLEKCLAGVNLLLPRLLDRGQGLRPRHPPL